MYILHDGDAAQQGSPDCFGNGSTMENGWILGSDSELLFCVPPSYRLGLWWPKSAAVMAKQSTKLDLSYFVHGTFWQQCRR